MAAVRTIDLAHQTFSEAVCADKGLTDHASNYSIKGFHNRNSSLFPTTQHNRLFTHTSENLLHDKDTRSLSNHCLCTGKPPHASTKSKILNRVQSATGRLEKNVQYSRNQLDIRDLHSGSSKTKGNRPHSAVVKNSMNYGYSDRATPRQKVLVNTGTKKKIPSGKRGTSDTSRYSSQQYNYGNDIDVSDIQQGMRDLEVENNEGPSYQPCDMAIVPINGRQVPVVDIGDDAPVPTYDYQQTVNSKYVSSEPKLKPFHTPCVDKTADIGVMNDVFSYTKAANVQDEEKEEHIKPAVFGLEKKRQIYGNYDDSTNAGSFPYRFSSDSQGMLQITYDGAENTKMERPLPESLETLRPWLTENVAEEFIGVDPKKCLVFLPSLIDQDLSDILEVPAPHQMESELPFKEKIITLEPPKKYEHPAFNKKPSVEDWVCEHSKTHTRIYGADGTILHERYQGIRNAGIVRKEIEELENLMKGIGTMDTDCSIVKYQAEIDKFRLTHEQTMALVPERLLVSPKPTDTFGLRQFYQQHDEIMHQIKDQHKLCLEELAALENEAGIESERKYFKHQVHLPRSDESILSEDT